MLGAGPGRLRFPFVLAFILVFFGRIWDVLVVFVWSTRGVSDLYLLCACGVLEAYSRCISIVFVAYRFGFVSLSIEQRKRSSLKTLCRAPSGALTIPTCGSSV
jgi:hypothetical protein